MEAMEAIRSSLPADIPLFIVSEMDTQVHTGVQTHFLDVLAFVREKGSPATFIGPDEALKRYLLLRAVNGVCRRLIRVNKQIAYAGLKWMTTFSTRRELKRHLKGLDSWVVYAQDPTTARSALALRRSPTHRVVLAVHYNISQAEEMTNRGILTRGNWLYRKIRTQERRTVATVDKVVVCSQFMRNQLVADGASREITVIPNTAETPRPTDFPSRDLIAIGSLEPRKNQQFLLRMLAEAKALGHNYSLTIVGDGEDNERLRALAEDLGINDQVLFTGHLANAATLIPAHKLLLHAALIENLPITLIEGLAAGVPILAAPVGGVPEIFREHIEGRFLDLNDVARSTGVLIEMSTNKERRLQMAEAARARYLDLFPRQAVFSRLVQVLLT